MWNEKKEFIEKSGKRIWLTALCTLASIVIFPIAIVGYLMLMIGQILVLPFEMLYDWYNGNGLDEEE
jgi:uncharacterized membrane protein